MTVLTNLIFHCGCNNLKTSRTESCESRYKEPFGPSQLLVSWTNWNQRLVVSIEPICVTSLQVLVETWILWRCQSSFGNSNELSVASLLDQLGENIDLCKRCPESRYCPDGFGDAFALLLLLGIPAGILIIYFNCDPLILALLSPFIVVMILGWWILLPIILLVQSIRGNLFTLSAVGLASRLLFDESCMDSYVDCEYERAVSASIKTLIEGAKLVPTNGLLGSSASATPWFIFSLHILNTKYFEGCWGWNSETWKVEQSSSHAPLHWLHATTWNPSNLLNLFFSVMIW